MAGIVATEMLESNAPAANKRRTVVAGQASKWKTAFKKKFGPRGPKKEYIKDETKLAK